MAETTTVIPTADPDRDIFASQIEGRNEELRREVFDSQGALAALHDDVTQKVEELKARWAGACEHHSKTVQGYHEEMSIPPGEVSYSHEELTVSLGLTLSPEFIQEYGPVGQIPIVSSLIPQFELLHNKGLRLREQNEFTDQVDPVTKAVLPLNQCNVVETLLKMNDLHHCDPLGLLKAEFAKLFQEFAAVEAQLSQVSEEREAALRSEDILKAEERGALVLALFDRVLDIVKKRTQSSEEYKQQVDDFQANVNNFLQEINFEVGQSANKVITDDAKHDIELLEKGMKDAEGKKVAEEETFEAESKEFRKEMISNTTAQLKVWDEILSLLTQLPALHQQRAELVAEQMDRVEKRQSTKSQFSSFLETCQERLAQTKSILSNCNAALELLAHSATYISNAVQGIQAKEVEVELANVQKDEKVRYYDVYRRYVLFTGDLLQRKQQRLENNKRMIRSTEFQISHAVESLDPDINVYKDQLRLFQKKESELSGAITEIRSALNREGVEWSPVEVALESLDITIEPPSLLLQELQRDLTAQHASAVDELTTTEQKALDKEKNSVRKLQNACVAAKASIEERRSTKQAASPSK